MFKKFLTMLTVAALVAPALAAEWMDNFEAAKAKAKAEKKLVLMDFTGSDWCGWCIKLRKEVLDTPEFEAYAKDKFVLMEVDCPKKKQLPAEVKKQNDELCRKYPTAGFPTVIVVTPKGTVVGGFSGYKKLEDLKFSLDRAIKAQKDIKKANKLEGREKELALDAVYQAMEPAARKAGGYTTMSQQDAAAQRADFEKRLGEVVDGINQGTKTPDEWLAVVNDCLSTALPSNKQFLLDTKFYILTNGARNVDDLREARKVGYQIVDCLQGQMAAHVKQQIDRDFAEENLPNLLKEVEAARNAAPQAPAQK